VAKRLNFQHIKAPNSTNSRASSLVSRRKKTRSKNMQRVSPINKSNKVKIVKLKCSKNLGKVKYTVEEAKKSSSISTTSNRGRSLSNKLKGVRFKEDSKNGVRPIIVSPMKRIARGRNINRTPNEKARKSSVKSKGSAARAKDYNIVFAPVMESGNKSPSKRIEVDQSSVELTAKKKVSPNYQESSANKVNSQQIGLV
jgi:hypothetical protein